MSRIRSVHPGFFTDEDFVSVSMAARLLIIGLGIEADDKGIFAWKPLTIKIRVFPADTVDVETLLGELAAVGAVRRYEIDGKAYGAIRNFRKFQKPKTPNDIHPATPEILVFVGLSAAVSETVPKDFPKGSEIVPQMEDGEEEEGEEELAAEAACASGDALAIDHVFDFWNQDIAPLGKAAVRKRSPERRKLVQGRIAQNGLDEFREVFANIRASPFLMEAQGLQFDWFMQKKNFTKVLEGNYND